MNSNLPIYFSNESGNLQNGNLEMSWTNDAEFEVDFYLIEASENGNEFVPVQKIFPDKNDGTRANYSIAIQAFSGFYFFRIKGREWNGNFTYSKIIKISLSALRESIRLFPNPVGSDLTLDINGVGNGIHEVMIQNSSGMNVYRSMMRFQSPITLKLPVGHLSPGLYFLSFNGRIAARFIKY